MRLSRLVPSAALALLLAACGGGGSTTASSANPAASGSPKAAGSGDMKPAAGAGKVVDLAPLPLKVTLPAEEAGVTMDKTMGDKKSVGVSYDAIFGGLNISEPADKSFDEVKKGVKGDTVMFPFKKWVEESATSAIAEVTAGDKTAYTAWSWKEIGGKKYVCQSAGMNGLKSVDDAKAVLKACDSLSAQ